MSENWKEWSRRELESIPSALINFSLAIAIFGIVFGPEHTFKAVLTIALAVSTIFGIT